MLYEWMLTCQKNKDGLGTPRCHYISKETLAQIELVLLLRVLYILHRKKNTIQMKQIGITCWQMKDRRNRKWLGHHRRCDVMELAH